MKIGQLPPIPHSDGSSSTASRKGSDEVPTENATKVSLSKDGAFIADMRSRAERARPVLRDDVVDRVKAELASGTFAENTDMERVVAGLLADL